MTTQRNLLRGILCKRLMRKRSVSMMSPNLHDRSSLKSTVSYTLGTYLQSPSLLLSMVSLLMPQFQAQWFQWVYGVSSRFSWLYKFFNTSSSLLIPSLKIWLILICLTLLCTTSLRTNSRWCTELAQKTPIFKPILTGMLEVILLPKLMVNSYL